MKFTSLATLTAAALLLQGSIEAGFIDRVITGLWKPEEQIPTQMKVLIVHDQPGVVLEVKGKYKLYDPNTNEFISTRFIGKRKFIQALNDGLKWGEEFPGVHQIKIVPDDVKTTTIVDGAQYPGDVVVYDIGGSVSVVNQLPLEEYLKVVLVPQFEKPLSQEAANAVAIVARTNAWYQVENSNNNFWVVEADQAGYKGSAAAYGDNGIAKALQDTAGMVIEKQGALVPAEWGSKSGGKALNSSAVFSEITLAEVERLAADGKNASEILAKAFPGSAVSLTK